MNTIITLELQTNEDLHDSTAREKFVLAALSEIERRLQKTIDTALSEDKPKLGLLERVMEAFTSFGKGEEPSIAQIVWVQDHAAMVSNMGKGRFTPEEIRRDVVYHARALAEVKRLHNCCDKCCPVEVALHDFPLN